jgi:stage II sporulation protein D
VMDQVYNWLIPTKEESSRALAVRKAIEETKSQVLANASGKLLPAYFHADCGGQTEEASAVWGPQEAKVGTATDAYCPFSPKAKWSWSLTSNEIYSKIRMALKLPWEGDLKEITVSEFTASGRVAKLALTTREGVRHFISGAQLRSLLGFDHLRSTAFTLSRQPSGQYKFDGRGYGHGVGLCQWGARKLANLGTNYKDILKHYYPSAVLATVE